MFEWVPLWLDPLRTTAAEKWWKCFWKMMTKITELQDIMHLIFPSLIKYRKVFKWKKILYVTFTTACVGLLCWWDFCVFLENVQGSVSSEQTLWSFTQHQFFWPTFCSICFVWFLFSPLYIALHIDDEFRQRCKSIYLCIHQGFAFSWVSVHVLQWMTDRFAPPPLPLAKKSTACTNFSAKTLIFPTRTQHEDRYF